MSTSRTVVSFDFDGTIVDTEVCEFEAWKQVESNFGTTGIAHSVRDSILFGPPHDVKTIVEKIAAECNVLPSVINDCYRRSLLCNPALRVIRPEATALMLAANAANFTLAICSGAPYSWIGHLLETNGWLDFFDLIVTRDAWCSGNEKSDEYRCLRNHYEVQGKNSFFAVEDSPRGIRDAMNGGWTPIYAPNGLLADKSHELVKGIEGAPYLSPGEFLELVSSNRRLD